MSVSYKCKIRQRNNCFVLQRHHIVSSTLLCSLSKVFLQLNIYYISSMAMQLLSTMLHGDLWFRFPIFCLHLMPQKVFPCPNINHSWDDLQHILTNSS